MSPSLLARSAVLLLAVQNLGLCPASLAGWEPPEIDGFAVGATCRRSGDTPGPSSTTTVQQVQDFVKPRPTRYSRQRVAPPTTARKPTDQSAQRKPTTSRPAALHLLHRLLVRLQPLRPRAGLTGGRRASPSSSSPSSSDES